MAEEIKTVGVNADVKAEKMAEPASSKIATEIKEATVILTRGPRNWAFYILGGMMILLWVSGFIAANTFLKMHDK